MTIARITRLTPRPHRRSGNRLLRSLPCALALLALTGCVTSKKYRLAKDDTPPAQVLDWTAAAPAAELKLHALIVFKGPGSWKREARWDEYVVQLANRGGAPLTIDSAELVDLLGAPQAPGDDPWKLEARSKANWRKYTDVGLNVVLGAGAVVLYGAAATAVATTSFLSGSAAAGSGVAALNIIPLIAVVDIAAVAVMNHHNKAKVQAEFDRRRLQLPLTLAPGAAVVGSLFFPMTPGPQRLIVRGKSADQPCELILELSPLTGLHLEKSAAAVPRSVK